MTKPQLRADPLPDLQLQTYAETSAPDHAEIVAQLERYNIATILKPSYEWGGFRYSNTTDAIAAAKRGQPRYASRVMSRAFNLSMTQADVVKHCTDKSIAISVIEALPGGGTRLVTMNGEGAEKIQPKLKRHIIEGNVRREQFIRRRPLW